MFPAVASALVFSSPSWKLAISMELCIDLITKPVLDDLMLASA